MAEERVYTNFTQGDIELLTKAQIDMMLREIVNHLNFFAVKFEKSRSHFQIRKNEYVPLLLAQGSERCSK